MRALICPRCGGPITGTAPGGYCPQCAGRLLLDTAALRETEESPPAGQSPLYLGEFELGPELGRGAMGVVYRARQPRLKRDVAVKVILVSRFAGESARKRFLAEAELAAQLDHPNIVPIYEVGETADGPFYAMKLVEGGTLADNHLRDELHESHSGSQRHKKVGDSRISSFQITSRLISKIACAVHHAHQRGVLHRDLKPGNILIDSQGEPHITDFGLARQLGVESSLTLSGSALGTPAYMAPEQAAGERGISTAADIWSLGTILFHLLAGRPPFTGESVADILLKARTQEAPSLRALKPSIPRDLETICLKCLEKDPARRYNSALAFAEDLERWLNHEPIHARASTAVERAVKWSRRHPARAGLVSLGVLAMLVLLVVVLFYNSRLQQKSAQMAETLLRQDWLRAEELLAQRKSAEGLALLARMLRDQPDHRGVAERILSALVHQDFALPAGPPLRTEDDLGFSFAAFSLDGRRLITGDENGLRLWDAGSFRALTPARTNESLLATSQVQYRLNSDGQIALSWRSDSTVPQTLRLWDVAQALVITEWPFEQNITDAAFSPDGLSVKISTAQGVQVRETRAHRPPAQFDSGDAAHVSTNSRWQGALRSPTVNLTNTVTGRTMAEALRHERGVRVWNVSPDEQHLVTAAVDRTARIWEMHSSRYAALALRHGAGLASAQFSPDGSSVLTLSGSLGVKLWDTRTGRLRLHLRHGKTVFDANFDPSGQRIITGADDFCARVWDAQTGREILPPLRHEHPTQVAEGEKIYDARFSADGRHILTSGHDATTRVWDGQTHQFLSISLPHESPVHFSTWSSDGARLLTSALRSAHLWDARTYQPVATLERADWSVGAEFSSDSRLVLVGAGTTASLFDAVSGQPRGGAMKHPGVILSAHFSPDGRWVISSDETGFARVWDARTGLAAGPGMHHGGWVKARFGSDSRRVVSFSSDRMARLWDARAGLPVSEPLQHPRGVKGAKVSPDGRWLLTVCDDDAARLWEVPVVSSAPPRWLPELAETVAGLRFNAQRGLEPVPFAELESIRQQRRSSVDDDVCTRWVKWFFTDDPLRAISPSSTITIAAAVEQYLEENTRESLREACRLSPTNALAHSRLREMQAR